MSEFATHYAEITAPENPILEVALIGAHHDDEKMANLEKLLAQRGAAVTRIIFTDSSARNLPTYTAQELPRIRWQEGLITGERNKIKKQHRIDLPDSYLEHHIAEAVEFGLPLMQGKQVILAPNVRDDHPDHRAAHEIAMRLAGNVVTVYEMDTLTGLDQNKNWMRPDLYINLSTRIARHEKQSYLLNSSQTKDVPVHERRAMFDALGMTRRRGLEIKLPHAAVLFRANNTTDTPLEDILPIAA